MLVVTPNGVASHLAPQCEGEISPWQKGHFNPGNVAPHVMEQLNLRALTTRASTPLEKSVQHSLLRRGIDILGDFLGGISGDGGIFRINVIRA